MTRLPWIRRILFAGRASADFEGNDRDGAARKISNEAERAVAVFEGEPGLRRAALVFSPSRGDIGNTGAIDLGPGGRGGLDPSINEKENNEKWKRHSGNGNEEFSHWSSSVWTGF
jgi:hypothetical protein